MASATFQIDVGSGYGTAGIAADAAASATVNCRIANLSGIEPSTIAWSLVGNHDSAVAFPSIATSGNPIGQIATFTLPSGLAQAWGIQCKVNGGTGSLSVPGSAGHTARSAVYVLDEHAHRPFFYGETTERHATHGGTKDLNDLLRYALRFATGSGLKRLDDVAFQATVTAGAGATSVKTLTPPDSSEWLLIVAATARDTGTDRAGYLKFATVKKISNVVTVVGDTAVATHENDATWDLTIVQGAVTSNVEIRGTPDGTNNTTFNGMALIFERT